MTASLQSWVKEGPGVGLQAVLQPGASDGTLRPGRGVLSRLGSLSSTVSRTCKVIVELLEAVGVYLNMCQGRHWSTFSGQFSFEEDDMEGVDWHGRRFGLCFIKF